MRKMKLLAIGFLIVGNLIAAEAFAEDVTAQPLTRADCANAGMMWNDSVNVCDAQSTSEEVSSAQPLTREACDRAGMTWNDNANVCDATSEGSFQAASQTTDPVESTILITIDKSSQRMTVAVDGIEQHAWPVSTGAPGYATPSGTFKASSMNEIWYSKQWDNAPMPHSIFFTKDGHAIHGSYETKRLGRAVSHGCVRLAPKNASTLYALVTQKGIENTTVVISGGPQEIVQPRATKRKPRYSQKDSGPPQKRCGLFKRRWCGGPLYSGPQGGDRPDGYRRRGYSLAIE